MYIAVPEALLNSPLGLVFFYEPHMNHLLQVYLWIPQHSQEKGDDFNNIYGTSLFQNENAVCAV